jgi:hypothetical protein
MPVGNASPSKPSERECKLSSAGETRAVRRKSASGSYWSAIGRRDQREPSPRSPAFPTLSATIDNNQHWPSQRYFALRRRWRRFESCRGTQQNPRSRPLSPPGATISSASNMPASIGYTRREKSPKYLCGAKRQRCSVAQLAALSHESSAGRLTTSSRRQRQPTR